MSKIAPDAELVLEFAGSFDSNLEGRAGERRWGEAGPNDGGLVVVQEEAPGPAMLHVFLPFSAVALFVHVL